MLGLQGEHLESSTSRDALIVRVPGEESRGVELSQRESVEVRGIMLGKSD